MQERHNLIKNVLLTTLLLIAIPIADFLIIHIEPMLFPRYSINIAMTSMTFVHVAIVTILIVAHMYYLNNLNDVIAIPLKVFVIILFAANYLVVALMSLITFMAWGFSEWGTG